MESKKWKVESKARRDPCEAGCGRPKLGGRRWCSRCYRSGAWKRHPSASKYCHQRGTPDFCGPGGTPEPTAEPPGRLKVRILEQRARLGQCLFSPADAAADGYLVSACESRGLPGGRGPKNAKAKLAEADVRDMRRRRAAGETLAALAARFGVSRSAASRACRGPRTPGARWRHVG